MKRSDLNAQIAAYFAHGGKVSTVPAKKRYKAEKPKAAYKTHRVPPMPFDEKRAKKRAVKTIREEQAVNRMALRFMTA